MRARLALLVTRWGPSWPSFIALYLLTLAHNPSFDFILVGDTPPASRSGLPLPLPSNVRFVHIPLDTLRQRLRETTRGVLTNAPSLGKQGLFFGGGGRGQDAKTNDFKPLFGEAFADVLRNYEWWGYIQEDMILGNLSHFVRPALLDNADVITPNTGSPRHLRANGAFMVFRNVASVNRLWRMSRDAVKMLNTTEYLIFDDWWGQLDNLARVLARANSTGRRSVRLHLDASRPPQHGPLRGRAEDFRGTDWRWVVDDTPTGWGSVVAQHDSAPQQVVCWRRGTLWVNVDVLVDGKEYNCLCSSTAPACSPESQVGVYHLYHVKRCASLSRQRVCVP